MVSAKNRSRDAHATFAGFVFQINVAILRWLQLLPGQHLALEADEDIDLIQAAAAAGICLVEPQKNIITFASSP